jgi:hypothetical protein
MPLLQTLKDQWNKFCCTMDGNDSDLFATKKVDDALAEQGWRITRTHFTRMAAPYGVYTPATVTVITPRGERANGHPDKMRAYYEARHAAAKTVYGLK